MTPLERAAQAIRITLHLATAQEREAADRAARAVLTAIREPSDLMGNGLPEGYRPGSHSATQIWRAMIDAALAEEG